MLIKKVATIKPSEITPENVYRARRRFIKNSAIGALSVGALMSAGGILLPRQVQAKLKLDDVRNSKYSTDEKQTRYKEATSYNNFYEFSTDKEEPARIAGSLKTEPWGVDIDGEVEKPARYQLEDLIKPYALEERIYRLRCVERWSMVIPWLGIPLASIIKRVKPTSKAKYVEFATLYDPKQFPGQRRRVLDWPYVEGLRMDEAMHPLTILAVGMYGKELPNQNGAPIRLVVPWKYGFKSIKSIVRIRFSERQPVSSWMNASPKEYGFYANVNPKVHHPRWSQAKERRIGEFLKRDTLLFNGYADEVASLYRGLDLQQNF